MKKSVLLLGALLVSSIFTSCASNKGAVKAMNETEAGELPILMVCPAPGQDFNEIFTDPDTIIEAEESYIEFYTNVDGAIVTINSQEMGETPLKVTKIPSGSYTLEISKEGYETFNTLINVNDNKAYKYNVTLTPFAEE